MNDCPNADVRDLLPDLLHARLDPESRALVEAHVAQCSDCAAELGLLRQLHASRRNPRIDVSSIAASIPAYRAPARRSWVGWRAAAAITVMVAGASSIAVLQRGAPASTAIAARPMADVAATPAERDGSIVPDRTKPASSAASGATIEHRSSAGRITSTPHPVAVPVAERELAMGAGALGDLNDRELASLLKDIESLDAVPSVDVESTPVSPIAPSAQGRP